MPLTLAAQPLAQILKNETASAHQEAEAVLLPALQAMRSVQDYATVLKMFYGFFHPLEERIRRYITPALLSDVESRRNASLIKKDLRELTVYGEPPLCESLPQINNAAQAFGALYVLEGSTLGGRVIVRMLSKNEAANIPANALHFFSGYGEETGRMWTFFINELNKQTEEKETVAAANETFFQLKNWIQKTLAHDIAR